MLDFSQIALRPLFFYSWQSMPQEAVMKVAIVCFNLIMYNKTSVSRTQVM